MIAELFWGSLITSDVIHMPAIVYHIGEREHQKHYAHSLSAQDARMSLRTRSTGQMAILEDTHLFEKRVRSGARFHSKALLDLHHKMINVRAHFLKRM